MCGESAVGGGSPQGGRAPDEQGCALQVPQAVHPALTVHLREQARVACGATVPGPTAWAGCSPCARRALTEARMCRRDTSLPAAVWMHVQTVGQALTVAGGLRSNSIPCRRTPQMCLAPEHQHSRSHWPAPCQGRSYGQPTATSQPRSRSAGTPGPLPNFGACRHHQVWQQAHVPTGRLCHSPELLTP